MFFGDFILEPCSRTGLVVLPLHQFEEALSRSTVEKMCRRHRHESGHDHARRGSRHVGNPT
ncbi:BQ5605_C015g07892 [Microbotryum silenes-dioicae]|uniref:BQ5605_C015g07892 protein n=1 Tax=Microbotryum silenes-dioicae TaxID=796604 RepID=A0A2X0MEQ2_9BASI|nr:BQ5605_C015g07892 [Microbotryum silenes-dioicae]